MADQAPSKELRIKLVALSGDELDLVRDEQGHLYVCITDDDRCTSMYLAAAEAAKGRDFLSDAYPAHEPATALSNENLLDELIGMVEEAARDRSVTACKAFEEASAKEINAARDRVLATMRPTQPPPADREQLPATCPGCSALKKEADANG